MSYLTLQFVEQLPNIRNEHIEQMARFMDVNLNKIFQSAFYTEREKKWTRENIKNSVSLRIVHLVTEVDYQLGLMIVQWSTPVFCVVSKISRLFDTTDLNYMMTAFQYENAHSAKHLCRMNFNIPVSFISCNFVITKMELLRILPQKTRDDIVQANLIHMIMRNEYDSVDYAFKHSLVTTKKIKWLTNLCNTGAMLYIFWQYYPHLNYEKHGITNEEELSVFNSRVEFSTRRTTRVLNQFKWLARERYFDKEKFLNDNAKELRDIFTSHGILLRD